MCLTASFNLGEVSCRASYSLAVLHILYCTYHVAVGHFRGQATRLSTHPEWSGYGTVLMGLEIFSGFFNMGVLYKIQFYKAFLQWKTPHYFCNISFWINKNLFCLLCTFALLKWLWVERRGLRTTGRGGVGTRNEEEGKMKNGWGGGWRIHRWLIFHCTVGVYGSTVR